MEQVKAQSLQHSAYREIKQRIVTLSYKPGEHINTAQICQQLRIGRTPVHLAIHRLESEGMIDILPRRGIVVRPVDRAEMMEFVEARLMIEPQVAALAAVRASDREFAAMRATLDRMVPCLERGDIEQFSVIDREFHRFIALAASNRPVGDFLSGMHERCLRIYFISVSRNEQDVRVVNEHEEIFRALHRRDADGAAAAMRTHIESFRHNVRDLL